ncbi:hypothetical protein FOZ63_021630, partial [Perkinsus olseni]
AWRKALTRHASGVVLWYLPFLHCLCAAAAAAGAAGMGYLAILSQWAEAWQLLCFSIRSPILGGAISSNLRFMCDFDSCLAEVDLLGGASSGAAVGLMDLKAVETTRELDDYNKQSFGGWARAGAEAPVLTGRFDCQYTAQ